MSSNQSSYTSYSSTSYTTSSSTANGGRSHARSYTESTNFDSQNGGYIQHELRETGRPTMSERRELPAQGQLSDGASGVATSRQIEDVTESEADTLYRERMEEEYAKREGGA